MMRKRALDNANYIVNQKHGDKHLTVGNQGKIQNQTLPINLLFSGTLRGTAQLSGTSQYWEQRGKYLRSLIQFKINEGCGIPSFFTTGSCAEFHFKPLKRLLTNYINVMPQVNKLTLMTKMSCFKHSKKTLILFKTF